MCRLLVPITVALTVLLASPSALAADDLAAKPGSLTTVPAETRPIFRWWWPTDDVRPAELRAELRAMKRAGFGGVEQSLLANDMQWGTPTFRARTQAAIEEANRLGMSFDVTLGPGWPVSSPATEDVSKELSSQGLHYGAVELDGPQTFEGAVPDNPPGVAGQPRRLIAVIAMQLTGGTEPQTLDPSSAVQLTSTVRGDGTLTWAVPAGRWKLFGFWMRPSLMRAKAPNGGSEGWYVVDHYNPAAIDAVLGDFDRMLFTGGAASALRRNGGDAFEDSYEVDPGATATGQSAVMWTRDLLDEFEKRRGYALRPLLPGLFAEFAFPGGTDARLKRDFQVTLNDLLIDRHLDRITAWARKKGLRSRAQAYQAGIGVVGTSENSRLAAAAQKPDVETLGFGDPNLGSLTSVEPGSADSRAVINRYRQVVSGAHLSGATQITNEWGAVLTGQFRVRQQDLKAFADRSLAAGVTRMALHGFAYRLYDRPAGATGPRPGWPGWCAFCGRALEFSDAWNQRWPQFKTLPGLAGYLGRAGAVVSDGRPRVDLTLLSATSVVNGLGAAKTAGTPEDRLRLGLQRVGYTWDALDPLGVPSSSSVSGLRLLPDGPAYKALVVDDQASLPAATAERLVDLARRGLPVVLYGDVPSRGAGYANAAAEDARVQAAIATLRKLRSVRVAATPSALNAALRSLAVRPDFSGAGTVIPVHRRTAGGDVWFLYNDSAKPVSGRFEFATGGAPTQIDLWTGKATRLAGSRRRSGVSVPVTLAASGTAVIAFDRRRALAGGVTTKTAGSPRTVRGPWRLEATTVAPAGDAKVTRTLSSPADWARIPGLDGKSGTGVYTAAVDVPASWLRRGRAVRLDPGDFGGALRVTVNGRAATVPTVPGEAPRDITALLRAGRNTLLLEVSTTLSNALRAQGRLGGSDYAPYASRPLEPAGLTGPVRLLPYVAQST